MLTGVGRGSFLIPNELLGTRKVEPFQCHSNLRPLSDVQFPPYSGLHLFDAAMQDYIVKFQGG